MIDEELKEYIHSLLKQGYDIDTIKETLIKAGHEIAKVEKLTLHVFELFHKDLTKFIDEEMKKGRTIDDIKDDLLKLGHSESKIKQVMNYHRKKLPIHKRMSMHSLIQQEKKWFKSWLKIYVYLFLVLIVIFGAVFLLTKSVEPSVGAQSYEEKVGICSFKKIDSSDSHLASFKSLCISMISVDGKACNEVNLTNDKQECEDAYNLYRYYQNKDRENCDNIKDPYLNEYCHQLSDGACFNYLGYESHCESIVKGSLSYCSSQSNSNSPLIGDCFDNYHFYNAMSGNKRDCKKITNEKIKVLCQAII